MRHILILLFRIETKKIQLYRLKLSIRENVLNIVENVLSGREMQYNLLSRESILRMLIYPQNLKQEYLSHDLIAKRNNNKKKFEDVNNTINSEVKKY